MAFCRRLHSCVHSAIRFSADSVIFACSLPFVVLYILWAKLLQPFKQQNGVRKVLLGIQEIASNLHSIQKCLDANGVPTTSIIRNNKYSAPSQFGPVTKRSRRHYLNPAQLRVVDAFLFPSLKAFYFFRYFLSHDIIWIIWSETFLPWWLDLFISKIAGKKLILMHCGDDVRYRPMQRVIDRDHGFPTWPQDLSDSKKFLGKLFYAKLSQACGTVVSLRNQSTFQEATCVMFRFPMAGSLAEPRKPGHIVRIVHAPSCRYTKGTAIVLDAIDHLHRTGVPFEFHLLENQPNDVVLGVLEKSDILIDQPADWVGRLAIEACAASCCVIGGNKAEYNGQFDSPVIQFERDSSQLALTLRGLIENRAFLQARMSACFDFWRKYYSEHAFFEYFQSLLTNQAETFLPLKNQKQLLLAAASGPVEKFFIRYFYSPRNQ